MTLKQLKAKARAKLRPQLTNTNKVKPEVVDFARLLLADFWQAQQKDLDEIIEATHQAVLEEVVRVAEGMKKDGSQETRDRIEKDGYGYLYERLVGYNIALTDLITAITTKPDGK